MPNRFLCCLAALPAALAWGAFQDSQAAEVFAHDTIHLGVVVADLEASAHFYAQALGLSELPGFEVPAALCTDAGLTDGHPLSVRVFSADPMNDDATLVKLMQLPGVEAKRSDNAFIHSQLGFSYLTVGVRDVGAALERVRAEGGAALAEGPVRLGERPDSDWLALVRDPDGNLIELIGPKR